MPTLISETDVRLERADLCRRIVLPRDTSDNLIVPPPRTPGLHLSGLLRYVAQKARITSYLEQLDDEAVPLRWALGIAWEEFAASLYSDLVWQPGEVTDPVIMTCDGIGYLSDVNQPCIEEFKCNRAKKYTGADMLKKKWAWLCQGAGYCIGYGCEFVRWHVLSVMEFPDPVYTKYLVGFTSKELDEMRKMIENNRAGAIEEGYCE